MVSHRSAHRSSNHGYLRWVVEREPSRCVERNHSLSLSISDRGFLIGRHPPCPSQGGRGPREGAPCCGPRQAGSSRRTCRAPRPERRRGGGQSAWQSGSTPSQPPRSSPAPAASRSACGGTPPRAPTQTPAPQSAGTSRPRVARARMLPLGPAPRRPLHPVCFRMSLACPAPSQGRGCSWGGAPASERPRVLRRQEAALAELPQAHPSSCP
mmetsp:Transcript_13926/g.32349  ORF Transcript_13926/g.32349 Transcript_13926/m.32349 type:complete len:211 (-) Transcript_13926:9-641(-)